MKKSDKNHTVRSTYHRTHDFVLLSAIFIVKKVYENPQSFNNTRRAS